MSTDVIDTSIQGDAADVNSAADWLDKLRTGFSDAETDLRGTALNRGRISGGFGDAVDEYAGDMTSACSSADDALIPIVDVTRSWADQLTWRKEDMAGHREDAVEGGLSVDGYKINAPEPVSDPGELADGATSQQKTEWEAADAAYDAYLKKKKLFDQLVTDVQDTKDKLTTWVSEHMVTTDENPYFEIAMNAVKDGAVEVGQSGVQHAYMGVAYRSLEGKARALARARAAAASGNPQVRAGKKPPNEASVAKRTAASMESRMPGLARAAKWVGKGAGVVGSLVISGVEIANGKSPSQAGLEFGAGMAGAVLGAAAVTAGAVALGVSLPGVVVGGAAIIVGGAVAYGVGKLYENVVPLQTREKIDEGIKDAWNWVGGKAESAWSAVFG